jgi:hypothetical protein
MAALTLLIVLVPMVMLRKVAVNVSLVIFLLQIEEARAPANIERRMLRYRGKNPTKRSIRLLYIIYPFVPP